MADPDLPYEGRARYSLFFFFELILVLQYLAFEIVVWKTTKVLIYSKTSLFNIKSHKLFMPAVKVKMADLC